jgi:hypothetical protein
MAWDELRGFEERAGEGLLGIIAAAARSLQPAREQNFKRLQLAVALPKRVEI